MRGRQDCGVGDIAQAPPQRRIRARTNFGAWTILVFVSARGLFFYLVDVFLDPVKVPIATVAPDVALIGDEPSVLQSHREGRHGGGVEGMRGVSARSMTAAATRVPNTLLPSGDPTVRGDEGVFYVFVFRVVRGTPRQRCARCDLDVPRDRKAWRRKRKGGGAVGRTVERGCGGAGNSARASAEEMPPRQK